MNTSILNEIAVKNNVTVLKDEVVIFVPSTIQANQTTDNSVFVNKVASELSILNGGCTITNAEGCWNSDELGLIKESVTLVSSSCDELTSEKLIKVFELSKWIKESMSQEMVSVKINGTLFLV